jgi:hypothetical protein
MPNEREMHKLKAGDLDCRHAEFHQEIDGPFAERAGEECNAPLSRSFGDRFVELHRQ